MSLRGLLLSFRIARFETTVIVGATILSLVVSAVVVLWWNAAGYARCGTDEGLAFSALCQASAAPWLERVARLSASLVPIFPIVAGLLAGGPIVARELETGTARLAWSLGPSRMRWFVQRALPSFVLVIVAALAIGAIAEALIHLTRPTVPLDASFVAFRSRGLLIAVQAFLMAAVALTLGAILGRSIPTLIVSLVLVGAIGFAVDKVETRVLNAEAVVSTDDGSFSEDNLYLDSRYRLPDGSLLTWEELVAVRPEVQNGENFEDITNANFYIPGERYHDVERREALVLALVALAFVGLGAAVVVRRRPR
jgi:hypothetical protein